MFIIRQTAFKYINVNNKNLINIINFDSKYNYSGSNNILKNMNIKLLGLEEALQIYENKYKN
jgi:hypothetical protein